MTFSEVDQASFRSEPAEAEAQQMNMTLLCTCFGALRCHVDRLACDESSFSIRGRTSSLLHHLVAIMAGCICPGNSCERFHSDCENCDPHPSGSFSVLLSAKSTKYLAYLGSDRPPDVPETVDARESLASCDSLSLILNACVLSAAVHIRTLTTHGSAEALVFPLGLHIHHASCDCA